MVIVSQGDVSENKLAWRLHDKTHAFGWRFVHGGGVKSYEPGKMVLMWPVT